MRVVAADGSFLGWGAFSPRSSIRARMWSFEEGEEVGPALFQRRIRYCELLRLFLGSMKVDDITKWTT